MTKGRIAILASGPRLVAFATATLLAVPALAAGAKGTVVMKGRSVTLKYAYLVKGPDELDPERTIRRVILSAKDLGTTLAACTTMSCTTADLTEGLTVDLDVGDRLNYWVVLNDQLVQHSGTKAPDVLKRTTDEPGRVAGTLTIDDTAMNGPKIEAEFDAVLTRELQEAR